MRNRLHRTRGYGLKLLLVWTAVVGVLAGSDVLHIREHAMTLALADATTVFQKDQSVRHWVASHGGVYVPATDRTPPNPFLEGVPERDIVSPQGKRLTLMNPAYAIRQLMEEFGRERGTVAHITSLKHFREETAPDPWERKALAAFEKKVPEMVEITEIGGKPFLRMMKPMHTEASCLKCHGEQGYRVGDVRGGVSVSVPMEPYLAYRSRETRAHMASFGALWLLGAGGILWTAGGLARETRRRDRAEDRLRASRDRYWAVLDSSLTGIYISQDLVIRYSNPRFADIHGYPPEDLEGLNSLDLVHPEDRERVASIARARVRGEPVPETYEIRCLTRCGATRWVQRTNTIIEFEGAPAILGNEIDVTEQRLADAELRASEAQLRRLSERLLASQEIERKHQAYELQEQVCQLLGAVTLRLESALSDARNADGNVCRPSLLPLLPMIRQAIADIRRIARQLSPLSIGVLGLAPAVSELCRQLTDAHPGLQVETAIDIQDSVMEGATQIFVYRTLEEVLTRAVRCEHFKRLEVTLNGKEGRVNLAVKVCPGPCRRACNLWQEEGDPDMELVILRRRTEASSGTMRFERGPDGEVTVRVSWPGTALRPLGQGQGPQR